MSSRHGSSRHTLLELGIEPPEELAIERHASPAALFDALVAGGAPGRRLAEALEVVGRPGESLALPLAEGDVLIWRALGEGDLAGAAVVAAAELLPATALDDPGRWLAGGPGGLYVEVVEDAGSPAPGHPQFLLDTAGRLPLDRLVVRPRPLRPPVRRTAQAPPPVVPPPVPAPAPAAPPAAQLAQPDRSVLCPPPAILLDKFGHDSSALTAKHFTDIKALAKTIAESQATTSPVHTVCLIGHTDDSGDDAYNVGLGERRAKAVEKELRKRIDKESAGLSGRLQFEIDSKGETSPVGDNTTAAGRAANRRVEAFLNRLWRRFCLVPPVAADDPTVGPVTHPVGERDFDAGTRVIDGETLRVRGNVVYPAETAGRDRPFRPGIGPCPIVFILHGNHFTHRDPADRTIECCPDGTGGFVCCSADPVLEPCLACDAPVARAAADVIPNHLGHRYFQRLLAQLGIVSVSIDCNAVGGCVGLDPPNIDLRAGLLLEAMQHFRGLHTGGDPTFGGRLDFARVGFFGHSRGGEAVLRAAQQLPGIAALAGVTLLGVLSLAPTDAGGTGFGGPGAPFGGFALGVILPAADGDVTPNDGAKFYDRHGADPFKSQLYIHGANHNFFNTEWPGNDGRGPGILTEAEHRALLSAYGCAFFRQLLLGQAMLRFLRGDELPPGVPADRVHLSFEQPGAVTVDDHENANIALNAAGQTTAQTGGLTAVEREFRQGGPAPDTFFGNTSGMLARTTASAGRFRSPLAAVTDLTGREVWVRAAEAYDGAAVPAGASGYLIGLEDNAGRIALADSDDAGGLLQPYDRRAADAACDPLSDFTKTILKTQRFPAGCFVGLGFDMTQVRAVVFRLNRNDGRQVAFDQLQVI